MGDLTKKQAYLAMYSFLEREFEMKKSDDIGALLRGMSLLQDGGTADPATREEWERAIARVKAGQADARLRFKK
jgi:hypothetical protein